MTAMEASPMRARKTNFSDVADVVRQRMRRVRKVDTKPEMIVRRLVHGLGYRYRLHRRDLPGSPDLVFPSRRKVIFVHGCFWHQHEGCKLANLPRSRTDYWLPKLRRNQERDQASCEQLKADGWKVLVVWECETEDRERLAERVTSFLSAENVASEGP